MPTDLWQELADVFATVGTKDIEDTFNYHRRGLRANLRGNLFRVALWQGATHSTLLSDAGRKGVVPTPKDEALGAVPFLSDVFKAKFNSEFSLGEEKMTECINDTDFITLCPETHLHLPLEVLTLVEFSETPERI